MSDELHFFCKFYGRTNPVNVWRNTMKYFVFSLMLSMFAVFSIQASAEPALVVKEFECGGFVPNPDTDNGLPPIAPLFTTQTQGVAVLGKVGKISCHFEHDVDLPRAVAARDFVCAVPAPADPNILLIADRQVMLATPGGKAILECKFGPSKGEPAPAP